jgi:hypothetical protein
MRLPQLLIIGAMKSGTTGLFFDLCLHPEVFEPDVKEPHALCSDDVFTDEGRAAYAGIYSAAAPSQLLCDASTGYSKLPDHTGVVERAVKLLPDDFRAVYILREPIDRIISQHHHEMVEHTVTVGIDEAVRKFPRYVQFSQYASQLDPWVEAIGHDRIRVLRFEDYTANRRGVTAELCTWLGLDASLLPPADSTIHNQASGKPVLTGFWGRVANHPLYRNYIRPLASPRVRNALQRAILPKVPGRPDPPTADTVAWLREQLKDDTARLQAEWNVPAWG